MQQFYYTSQEIDHGPVTANDLKKLAASGALKPTDLVWSEGKPRRPAEKVRGLFPARKEVNQPAQQETAPAALAVRSENEKFCESCGESIHVEINMCPHCGTKQKTAGISGFVKKQISKIKAKIATARAAIDEEMNLETGISAPHKALAVIVALSAGWTGITGLGSIVAGRKKAGFAMLGLPLILAFLTFACLMATLFSAIASIFIIGIPFLMVFGTFSMILVPLFATTYIGFYIADVMVCIKAK